MALQKPRVEGLKECDQEIGEGTWEEMAQRSRGLNGRREGNYLGSIWKQP